jgi:hypothetical protein
VGYYLKTVIGAVLFLGAIVAFNYALIQLLQVGTCASGNTPYAISRPCPSGAGGDAGILVGSIFAGLIGAGIFAFRGNRPGHDTSLIGAFSWGTFAWGLFFAATGAASLIAVITDNQIDSSGGGKLGGGIVGVTFLLMGVPALIFAFWGFYSDRDKRKPSRAAPSSGPAPTAQGGLLDTLRSSAGSAASTASAGWSRLTPSSSGSGGGDALDKIDRLNKLRESGALTQAEFEREKAKLLAE